MADQTAEPRFGMVVDLAACVGCNACVIACKQEHSVPLTKYSTWVESWDAGAYPAVKRANLPKLCNHCADAPCIAACPTEASYVEEGGIVFINKEECIGCGKCVDACPYGARWLDEEEKVAGKCVFCIDRALAGLLPACAGTCPSQARVFGDLNDPGSEASKLLAKVEGEGLLPELGLETHVYYLGLSELMNLPAASPILRGGRIAEHLDGAPADL